MNAPNKQMRRDSGIALLTTLLLMLLMSSLLVGFVLLISSGQKLSGYNNDYSKSFYAAEAGMEKLTADIGTLFDTNYSPTGAQINALTTTPPALSGINYIQYNGASGYNITFPTDANGNPLATNNVINSGSYEGMTALQTLYTLNVTARTTSGSEVKLQRTTQTVGIPMFQFGIFSATDLSFFAGPVFSFGGRTATNGNLFLAANPGPLTLSEPVSAFLNVIRTNLSNGYSTSSSYNGTVNVFNGSSTRPLAETEGSLVGTIGSATNPSWPTISLGTADYAGNLRNGATGANQLNLGIVLLGNGTTQPVDMIRRPYVGESASVTNLRYFAQASLKVLLSDNSTDISSLPCIDTSTTPFDLSTLAMPVANWTGAAATLKGLMNTNNTAGLNTPPVPLAASGAAKGAGVTAYNTADGYWLPTPNVAQYTTASGLPIIKGFIKIEIQTAYGNPCGTWKDVTLEVLSYGYAGRDINPWSGLSAGTGYGTNEPLLGLPGAQVGPPTGATACQDVHPNAIIRLERVRDNPSNWGTGVGVNANCGVTNSATPATQIYPQYPADYWPNALFDTREGTLRDINPTGTLGGINYSQMVTLGGVMQYVEVDAKNVARYLGGALGGSGHLAYDTVNAPNDYLLYVSDRRGNYTASALTNAWPPLSPSNHETGEYGWDDFVNLTSVNGCPNGTQDTGEDLDGLGSTGFYTYGQNPTYIMGAGTIYSSLLVGQYGTYSLAGPGNLYGATAASNAITANPSCTVTTPSVIWPMDYVIHANEARENPNPFFRRAIKIMDGNLLTALGTCPGGVPCGLAIATENPAYVWGDFNANSAGGGFGDPNVAVSVNADAVTFLSNGFNDVNTFAFPYSNAAGTAILRIATNGAANGAYYRTAIMAGKGVSFPQPTTCGTAACSADFGTDGGVHNFLRYIENWGGGTVAGVSVPGQALNYRGSIISMYYNRQALGLYKCCTTVYSPPSRGYAFDSEFLTPSLLPPRTPLFRDVNTTGFTQLLLPSQ
jgi:Tfp pilus assembly protein PilX